MIENPNPKINDNVVHFSDSFYLDRIKEDLDFTNNLAIDKVEVFEYIKDIVDPEHPLSLEQLSVVSLDDIYVDNDNNKIIVEFTPTIPNCSSASLIGLLIITRLKRAMPNNIKVYVKIKKNTHELETGINKQLNDKERVLAALENPALIKMINDKIIGTSDFKKILNKYNL